MWIGQVGRRAKKRRALDVWGDVVGARREFRGVACVSLRARCTCGSPREKSTSDATLSLSIVLRQVFLTGPDHTILQIATRRSAFRAKVHTI